MNATDLRALLARWAGIMADKRDWLIELASVVGDSDLGLTMSEDVYKRQGLHHEPHGLQDRRRFRRRRQARR